MQLTSPAFNSGSSIPVKYSCTGEETRPPLIFAGIPSETKSLALILEDPDAPEETWNHWLVWNIPPTTDILESSALPKGAVQGTGSGGEQKYEGPCPPEGTHRYIFTLYALDAALDLEEGADKSELFAAMQRHIITQTELVGLYTRDEV